MVRILVADDDRELLTLVQRYLEKEGYQVKAVHNGQAALSAFDSCKFSLVILDIMMPELDGIEVCRILREKTTVPIIMLTARDDEVDKLLGLRIGADDYITKPFSIRELLARVKAQLRRSTLYNQPRDQVYSVLCFKGLTVDALRYQAYRNGKPISLTAKEFELLALLASNPGKVFTKKQIYHEVWGEQYFEADNTIMVHIRRLRKKIEPDPDQPQYIKTVWGVGYRFEGEPVQ